MLWGQTKVGDTNGLPEVETTARAGLAMRRRLLGNAHQDVARSLDGLSWILMGEGKLEESEAAVQEGLALRKELLGNEHPELARSYFQLAEVLTRQRKFVDAERQYRKAIALQQQMMGAESWNLAMSLGGLGQLLAQIGRLPDAETSLREAVRIGRKRMGADHLWVVGYLHDLSDVLRREGKAVDAEALVREFLEAQSPSVADDQPTIAVRLLSGLASLLREQKRAAEGRAYAQQAVDICYRHSNGVPGWLQNNAFDCWRDILTALHDSSLLEAAATQHVQNLRARSPADDHYLAVALANLADVREQKGKLVEARASIEEALALCAAHLSQIEAWQRRRIFDAAWRVFSAAKDTARLETVALQSLQEARATHATDDPGLAVLQADVADVLLENGKPAEARTMAEESVAICRSKPKSLDPWMLPRVSATLRRALAAVGDSAALKAFNAARIEDLRRSASEGDDYAQNELAWWLATAPDADSRDGANAVALAEKAVAATGRKNPQYLDTLAAAYAEAGKYPEAVRAQQEAVGLASPQDQERIYLPRLRLYEANKPYRQPQ